MPGAQPPAPSDPDCGTLSGQTDRRRGRRRAWCHEPLSPGATLMSVAAATMNARQYPAEGADMDGGQATERALHPEDLDRLFLERANAGDVDGVLDLYEPDAVLAFAPGRLAAGRAAIR